MESASQKILEHLIGASDWYYLPRRCAVLSDEQVSSQDDYLAY